MAGEQQPAFVHALAHAMNAALGNVGKTVTYTESIEVSPVNQMESLRDLANDLNAGKVSLLLILRGNPLYDAPGDLNFASAITKAKLRVSFRACTTMKPLSSASGTRRQRITWRHGAMRGPTTERWALFSR